MPLTPGTRLGPYEIVAPLGAGGMGEVYRATDTRLDRQVAIKVLPPAFAQDPDRLARFEREAKAVAALSHPNILSIFDFGVHEGQTYAVTELLAGETLRDRLAEGALPLRKAIEYAGQIARGLAAAHDKGIVHRDLKPDNIFVSGDGRVKILDFGLARPVAISSGTGHTQTAAALTDPGTVMGTVGYMAPEQIRGQAVDGRTDLFSLGAVLYEMLAGRRAFQRDTAADTMTAILKEDPPEFTGTHAEVPPALDRIVRHCLEKNAIERFQSARDVAFALEALSGSTTSSATVPPPGFTSGATPGLTPIQNGSTRRRLPRLVAAAALVAALVTAGLVGRATAPAGAAPQRFTVKTFEPQSIGNARFMPDGQSIVYSSALTGNVVQLYEIRSGTLEARPVGPPRTHLLSVSSKGELAVLTGAQFVAQRLFKGTLARMPLDGSPRPWMEGVREADWSPDGTTLAIVHDLGTKDRLEYPIGTTLYESAGYLSDPRVSPDGTRVAFMDHPARWDDRGFVKMVDRAGTVTTLAGEFWGEEGIAWSPDGSAVLFAANARDATNEARPGEVSYEVRSVAIDHPGSSVPALPSPGDFTIHDIGSGGRWLATRDDSRLGVGVRLASDSADRDLSWLNLSWSPALTRDGTRVLFSDGTAGSNYGVVWRKTDGSPLVRLGEGDASGWSPDEKWALALIYSPPQLVLYPIGAGDPVRLKRGAIERYANQFWFPDGKSLLIVGNEAGKPLRTYRQEIPDGDPVPVLEGVVAVAITPDGTTILGVDRDKTWHWYPVSGGAPRPALGLTVDDIGDGVVGWGEDGKSFFVRSGQDVPARIDRVDVATGRRELLRVVGPADLTGLFNFNAVSVSKDGAQYAYRYRRRLSTLFVVARER